MIVNDIFELETKQIVAGHDHNLHECEYWSMHGCDSHRVDRFFLNKIKRYP